MEKGSYPTSVFCIIATEFCERFSFCGLRTILSLYLRNELLFSENTATVVYHVFIMVCYIIPTVGAVCADSFLGRYRTILYFSLIYLTGSIIMCLAAVSPLGLSPVALSVLGLGLIATGTGGIKPCVAAFGGDQFHLPQQEDLLRQFFSIFYFTINLGGFVGMIITPFLKNRVTCFGEDTCYALGFGFPAALMFLALLLFVMGKTLYRVKQPKQNVLLRFIKCATHALVTKCKSRELPKRHWLDYARDKYEEKLINDMKIMFAVFWLYTPLPIFWSLFDQQGSRWTFQASKMDGKILGFHILPDQMQVVNPAIVLLLIPLFDRLVCPFLNRLNILENSLQRMALGGLVAGFAFLSAGIVELVLEATYTHQPAKHRASLNFINTLPCPLTFNSKFGKDVEIGATELYTFKDIVARNKTWYNVEVALPEDCESIYVSQREKVVGVLALELQIETIIFDIDADDRLTAHITDPVDYKKSLSGKPRVRIVYIKSGHYHHHVTISFRDDHGFADVYFVSDDANKDLSISSYLELPAGTYHYKVASEEESSLMQGHTDLKSGAVYTLVLRERFGIIEFSKIYTMSPPNSINMFWLIPQYFLISVAEIMFGVAGLEFSFTQAPKSMKTIILAAWYLSVAVGNLIVIIITQAKMFSSQAHEFMLFAVLIVTDMMVFTEMASKYHFVQIEPDSSDFIHMDGEEIPLLETEPLIHHVHSMYQ